MTLNELIIFKRLGRCRDDLRKPESEHLHISQIAYYWGFATPVISASDIVPASVNHQQRHFKERASVSLNRLLVLVA